MDRSFHDRKYYLAHREKIRARALAHRKANPEGPRWRAKQWAKDNPDRAKDGYRKWYLANAQKVKNKTREYRKNNPDKRSAERAARRAKTTGAAIAKNERSQIHALYKLRNELTAQTGIPHHVDHIMPLSKGGEHRITNLQILTASENMRKHARIELAQGRLA